MPGTWKSDVLLNLVLIAKSDGELKPIEILCLSRSRDAVLASMNTLADAVMRSYGEGLVIPTMMITQETALKEMIVMAAIDGCTDDRENDLVLNFIDASLITPERAAQIVGLALTDVKRRISEIHIEMGRRAIDYPNTDLTRR